MTVWSYYFHMMSCNRRSSNGSPYAENTPSASHSLVKEKTLKEILVEPFMSSDFSSSPVFWCDRVNQHRCRRFLSFAFWSVSQSDVASLSLPIKSISFTLAELGRMNVASQLNLECHEYLLRNSHLREFKTLAGQFKTFRHRRELHYNVDGSSEWCRKWNVFKVM